MARLLYLALLLGVVLARPNVCNTEDARSYACKGPEDCASNENCTLAIHVPAANYGHCLVDKCYRLCRLDSDCRGDKVHPNGDRRMAKCGEYQEWDFTGVCIGQMPQQLPLPGHPAANTSTESVPTASRRAPCYQDWQCDQQQVCNRKVTYDPKKPFRLSAGRCVACQTSQASRVGRPPFQLPRLLRSISVKHACFQNWQCPQGQVCNRDASYHKSNPFKLPRGLCGAPKKSQASRVGVPSFQLPCALKLGFAKTACAQNWQCPQGQVCNRDTSYDKSNPFKLNRGLCGTPGTSQAGRVVPTWFQLPRWLNGGLARVMKLYQWPRPSLHKPATRRTDHVGQQPPNLPGSLHDLECSTRESCTRLDQNCRNLSPERSSEDDCPNSSWCSKGHVDNGDLGKRSDLSTSRTNNAGSLVSLRPNQLDLHFEGGVAGRGAKRWKCKSDRDCEKGKRCDLSLKYGSGWGRCSNPSRIGEPSTTTVSVLVSTPSNAGSSPRMGGIFRLRSKYDRCITDSDCGPGLRCSPHGKCSRGRFMLRDTGDVVQLATQNGAGSGSVPLTARTTVSSVHQRSEAPLLQPPFAFAAGAFEPLTLPALETGEIGTFAVVGSSGVPAMHAALMPNGKVMFLDKVEYFTELRLANGQLAYSSIYDPATQGLTPLSVPTNAFCCGGSFLADGRVIAVGGSAADGFDPTVGDGFNAIRYLANEQQGGWSEPGHKMSSNRWYASAQMLEDGSIFVASGSKTGLDQKNLAFNNPTYEILNRDGVSNGDSIEMDILVRNQPYFLYPFLHLLKDGNLFVFVARSSQLFHAQTNQTVKELPDLPGLFRTYSNTGGSVLLPLTSRNDYDPEIMICGGGAVQAPESPTDPTCGRIHPLAENPTWAISNMPEGRCMVEGTLLPDGTILWLNGAMRGAQGWGIASEPALEALIYNSQDGSWTNAGRTAIARLYHSVALLLLDGSVLISGSNPSYVPVLADQVDPANPTRAFPTEFSVEVYTPPYLVGENALRRPTNVKFSAQTLLPEGGTFSVSFDLVKGTGSDLKVVLYHGGFVTHSLHMGARMILLDHEGFKADQEVQYVTVKMPDARYGHKVVPPGPYVVYVVVDGIPAVGQFVMVQ